MQILSSILCLGLATIVAGFPASDVSNVHLDPSIVEALEVLGKTPNQLRQPGSVPNPGHKPGTDLLPGIDHIVMLMMENHSFDNIWGTLDRPDIDGFDINHKTGKPVATVAQKYTNGSTQDLYPMPKTCQPTSNGPTQNWLSSHTQYNNGSMDGWVVGGGEKPIAMGYFTEDQLPFTHALGKTFPIGDRFFCSLLGQTWPNRMYLIGATSMGMVATGQNITGLLPPRGTIFNMFDDYNISWANYVAGYPETTSTPDLFTISDLETLAKHGKPFDQFYADTAAGTLPQFSLLDENYTVQSQENPQNIVAGEAMISDVVHALSASPLWSKTLLIINYDEHGGYYDHVPPPVALAPDTIQPIVPAGEFEYEGYRRYGFRVPAMVISPWSKKNHVSHMVYDHTSILALLETKWNLPAMTMRDANANNMLDFIDLEALAKKKMNFPDVNKLGLGRPGNTTENLACSATEDAGVIPPVGTVHAPSNGGKPGKSCIWLLVWICL
ncbi:hypothetical protein B7463_g113, partial [Scytalidium lignicola]